MKKGLKATTMRTVLIFLIVILIIGGAGGFYLGLQQVQSYAVEVSHTAADAHASERNIDDLQQLKQNLAESETLVAKANQLFATDASYQSQALKDIQKYASSAGITIVNTNFDSSADSGTPSGLSGHNFVISIQSPVSYSKLITFLDSIEGNLPKMQVVSVDLSRATGGGEDTVSSGDIKIAIATR